MGLMVGVLTAAGYATPPPAGNGNAAVTGDSMEAVVKRTFTAHNFTLEGGRSLPEMTLAYETYGRLALAGRNATATRS